LAARHWLRRQLKVMGCAVISFASFGCAVSEKVMGCAVISFAVIWLCRQLKVMGCAVIGKGQ